ncbi:O-Antigen ligase [bacterium A37T11]|nr:O-Antigen ligase [bacterium A37T11]
MLLLMVIGNRSFFAGLIISLTYLLYHELKNKAFRGRSRGWIFVISMLIVTYITVFIKPDSSLGRLFIYKITSRIIIDHPWAGIGPGNFPLVYGRYQLSYFKAGAYSQKELLLADNTKHAFNDYLEFAACFGLPSFLFLLAGLWLLLRYLWQVPSHYPQRPPLFMVCAALIIMLLVAALFTPVFDKWYWQSLLLAMFGGIIYSSKPIYPLWLRFLPSIGIIFVIIFYFGYYVAHYAQYRQWHEARQYARAGYQRKALTIYRSLNKTLVKERRFAVEFAQTAINLNNYSEAKEILTILIKQDSHSLYYSLIGRCYQALGNGRLAEAAFVNAVYQVPNRFMPRKELFDFYVWRNDKVNAIRAGQEVMGLPIKIPSFAVDQIRHDIQAKMDEWK